MTPKPWPAASGTSSSIVPSPSDGPRYVATGRCGFCLEAISTDQRSPCEATTVHAETSVSYLDCPKRNR